MLKHLKSLSLAAVIAVAAPIAAMAAVVNEGTVTLMGEINTAASSFSDGGTLAFNNLGGGVTAVSGDFDMTLVGQGGAVPDLVLAVGEIWTVGPVAFEISELLSVSDFVFSVAGTLTGVPDNGPLAATIDFDAGSDSTKDKAIYTAIVTVSAVPLPAGLLLMGTALAGLGLTRRKKA